MSDYEHQSIVNANDELETVTQLNRNLGMPSKVGVSDQPPHWGQFQLSFSPLRLDPQNG